MKVFISWSGERSQAVGELLDNWLQCVLQAVDPWMSSRNIDRGSLWFSEITNQLKDTSIGIICLTQENKDKPWILFEAGALAKGLTSNKVCTFLIDLENTDLQDPLAQFNHTHPVKESVRGLVQTINNSLGEKSLKENILDRVFDTYWPQFESEFNSIVSDITDNSPIEKRSNDDILSELLSITRSLNKRVRGLESQSSGGLKVGRLSAKEVRELVEGMIEEGASPTVIRNVLIHKHNQPMNFVERLLHKYFVDGSISIEDKEVLGMDDI